MSSSSLRSHRIIIASLFLPNTVVIGAESGKTTPPVKYTTPRKSVDAPDAALAAEVSMRLEVKELNPPNLITRPSATFVPVVPTPPTRRPSPLKSIVEDLKDRTRNPNSVLSTPRAVSPAPENINPFSRLGVVTPNGSGKHKHSLSVPTANSPLAPPTSSRKTSLDSSNPQPNIESILDTVDRKDIVDKPVDGNAALPMESSGQPTPASPIAPAISSPPVTPQRTSVPRSQSRRRIARRKSRSLSRSKSVSEIRDDDEPNSGEPRVPFYIEPNPHCNGGLKNAIDSVSYSDPQHISLSLPRRPQYLRKKLWVGVLSPSNTSPSPATSNQADCASAWIQMSIGVNSISSSMRQRISSKLRGEHESEVVWVEDGVFERAYDGFCHEVLWPALHYIIPDAPRTTSFYETVEASFKDYVEVNRRFAEVIKGVWREGDIVWVNDYHLMLLPAMLRAQGMLPPHAPIGFFLHVAFPSSELFRCLSVRIPLLRGILGADMVGFQTASYARHFRQTVSRILAVEALPRGIQLGGEFDHESEEAVKNSFVPTPLSSDKARKGNEGLNYSYMDIGAVAASGKGRFVDVGVFPMGIDVAQLKERIQEPEVGEWISLLRSRYAGMKLLVGRDKLDEIQGVRQKIQAFEFFLDKYPEWRQKVVLIQICLPSSSDSNTSTASTQPAHPTNNTYSVSSAILTPIAHINSKYSTLTYQPVVFLHTQDVNFSQYLALLSAADAFIVTSLREGMALRTHEYVVTQEGRERPLILSEFAGSYSYSGFRSCIAINPWNTAETAAAINQALTMSDEEARSRWEDLHNHVITQTAPAFVTSFLTRLVRANAERTAGSSAVASPREGSSGPPNLKEDLGRMMGKWRHSQKRVVLIDWEGSLIPRDVALASARPGGPSEEETFERPEVVKALEVLKKLAEGKKNEVWVLSGLPVNGVLDRIVKSVPHVGIVAENGCFLKPRPTRPNGSSDWISLVSGLNMMWKGPCLEILNYFTERTPGSFVEEREASVVWRFWTAPNGEDNADRQWARRQAAEAQNHIFDSLGERYGLRIIPGSNSFLVLPNNISRSTAVGTILQFNTPSSPLFAGSSVSLATWMSPGAEPLPVASDDLDFVLALSADEKLLRRLNELDNSETCSTDAGRGTDAKWRLDAGDLVDVLGKFGDV